MKRKIVRENKNAVTKYPAKNLREEERPVVDLKSLKEVKNQFDCLMEQMLSAKLLLAGLAVGANDVSTDSNVEITGQNFVDE